MAPQNTRRYRRWGGARRARQTGADGRHPRRAGNPLSERVFCAWQSRLRRRRNRPVEGAVQARSTPLASAIARSNFAL